MSAPTAKPPTCRELLQCRNEPGPYWLADADLATRAEAVLELHKPLGPAHCEECYAPCVECGGAYPCPTVRRLNGERE